jgi:DNA polymerase-3 subunit gamma/tau
MGNVPNTVFERLMTAISENQSAAVIEEINRLLDAGNSPAQLARQFVRYLRNCLMARLGGESTELLQISADERARAARSAQLFSEEDLTRFLDIMLRTFDQLNYRQEQRFHLELGLLKLVHLQRLLPIEQLLSRLPSLTKTPAGGGALPSPGGGATNRATPASTAPVPALSGIVESRPYPAPQTSAPFSPFAREPGPQKEDRPTATHAERPPALASSRILTPFEAAVPVVPDPETTDRAQPLATVLPQIETPEGPDLDKLRDAICLALEGSGHNTAAALLAGGRWTQESGTARVEVNVKKTMLGLTMNAEAEKIVKTAAREAGWLHSVNVVSAIIGSTGNGAHAEIPARRPPSGSLQAEALAHPLVKQALELFNGEVRSVLDLREKGNS